MLVKRLISAVRTSNEVIKPFFGKPRCPCPFYKFDFDYDDGIFHETNFSYCPLSAIDCLLKHESSGPDWNRCPFNCEDNKFPLAGIFWGTKITPKEFWPKDYPVWKGMPTIQFFKYVMHPNTPRPKPRKIVGETTTV